MENKKKTFSEELEITSGWTIEQMAEWDIKNYVHAGISTHRGVVENERGQSSCDSGNDEEG